MFVAVGSAFLIGGTFNNDQWPGESRDRGRRSPHGHHRGGGFPVLRRPGGRGGRGFGSAECDDGWATSSDAGGYLRQHHKPRRQDRSKVCDIQRALNCRYFVVQNIQLVLLYDINRTLYPIKYIKHYILINRISKRTQPSSLIGGWLWFEFKPTTQLNACFFKMMIKWFFYVLAYCNLCEWK